MEKTDTKPVGIWIRVSTEDQAKGERPEYTGLIIPLEIF
jgi:hypothetical protein